MFKFGIFVTLIIRVFYSVQGQSLSFCENPIEGQTCQITCTTPDHNQAVSFLKTSTVTTIGTCSGGTCGASPPFIISQPTGTTTVLSFTLTRNDAEEWQCDYGSLQTTGTLKWGTYPTSITANGFPTSTTITTEQEVDVKLECLYSESPPTVTLYHTSSASISTSPIAPVTCTSTADVCTDPDFTTYTCKVKISPSDQLDCSETYSLGVYVKISNVETVSNSSALGSGITYECATTFPPSTSPSTPSLSTTQHTLTTSSQHPEGTSLTKVLAISIPVIFIVIILVILVYRKVIGKNSGEKKVDGQTNEPENSQMTEEKLKRDYVFDDFQIQINQVNDQSSYVGTMIYNKKQ